MKCILCKNNNIKIVIQLHDRMDSAIYPFQYMQCDNCNFRYSNNTLNFINYEIEDVINNYLKKIKEIK